MRCPYCACEETRVTDSRGGDGDGVRRRRECQSCNSRFTTFERVELDMPTVVKSDSRREKFDEQKLQHGMQRALEKRPIDAAQIDAARYRIMRALYRDGGEEIAAARIGEVVMAELRELDEVAFVRFASVYRKFQDAAAFSDEVDKLQQTRVGQNQETFLSEEPETK